MREFNFISAVIVRPEFDSPTWNVVLFAESPDILEHRDVLMEASDIVHARYRWDRFLIEFCPDTSEADVLSLESAFQFDSFFPLYCIPYAKRDRLPDAKFFACDFITYTMMWKSIVGPDVWHTDTDAVDLDMFWDQLYDTENFALFRLVLPN